MNDVVIQSEGLGKSYLIGHEGPREKYTTLRDVVSRQARQVFESSRRAWRGQAVISGQSIEEFWALRDVSLEIKQGEVVGIIGRNGAGKSTLLKILSRITEPTEGRVTLRGRVASLLEVGTGFHPELTGRENIFLNGAILGMTHREIKRKFDEIVAFADADKFLDTPVKRYSSGMQVRLAFAVAAHLEPEILVVDEVLAVGDAEFQKKCLGKMEDVSKDGRTVLFVSHTMSAVRRLCRRGMVLDQGRVIYNGAAPEAIDFYMGIGQQTSEAVFARKRGEPSIIGVRIDSDAVRQGHVLIDIAFASPIPLHNPVPGFVLYSAAGTPVFGSNPRIHSDGYASSTLKQGVISFSALDVPICSGHYRLSVWLGDWHRDYDYKPEAVAFDFINPREPLNRSSGETIGHLTCPGQWRLSDEQSSSSNSYIEPEATRNLVSSAELDVD